MMEKPSYTSSRQYLWLSVAAAWTVIGILSIGAVVNGEAVAFGTIALPSMVAIIVGNFAAHRGFGSVDFRAQRHENPPSPPAGYEARDQPNRASGDAA